MAPNMSPRTNEKRRDISRLPVDILLEILSRLELRDSVATRTLSSYWREAWDLKHPSILKFNWKSMFLTEKNKADWEKSQQPCVMQRDRFLQAVDQFLQFYKGTDVELFSIEFCLGREHAPYIDKWVNIAVKRVRARFLKLSFLCEKDCELREVDQLYKLNAHLLLCKESRLKGIHLDKIEVSGDDGANSQNASVPCVPFDLHYLQNSSSFFINLTALALSRIRIPAVITAESFPHLVKLGICMCSNVREIKLNNQKLLVLLCVSSQPVAFNIGGAPNLVELRCYANEFVLRSVFSLAAQEHQSLKVMRIMSYVDWGDCIPRIGGTMGFRTVTELFLAFDHSSNFDISKHVTLLRVFPNLKKLKLLLDCPSDVEQGAVSPTDDMMHMHLEEVEISGFHGSLKQIEFIIFLLKNAPALKTLSIFRCSASKWDLACRETSPLDYYCKPGRKSWDDGEHEKICNGLSSVTRKDVKVVIQDP